MTKEKQIEEMTKIIFMYDSVNSTDEDVVRCAKHLYNAGYRKASEVAREVIDVLCELHDHFKSVGDIREAFAMLFAIAELKKKYTEATEGEE